MKAVGKIITAGLYLVPYMGAKKLAIAY